MTNWVTSDLHLHHKKILDFCSSTRPYADLAAMHDSFRKAWQERVEPEDVVYILGDVSFGSKKQTAKVFEDLAGKIVIIKGNHDNSKMLSAFDVVLPYHEVIIEMTRVCMFHFPIASWHKKEHGSVHVHGHMHGTGQDDCRRKDVGVDATRLWLTDLDKLVLKMLEEPYLPVR